METEKNSDTVNTLDTLNMVNTIDLKETTSLVANEVASNQAVLNSVPTGQPIVFSIAGMHCAACSSRIERVVGAMEDVGEATVNLTTETLFVHPAAFAQAQGQEQILGLIEKIIPAVSQMGFTATYKEANETTGTLEGMRNEWEEQQAATIATLKQSKQRLIWIFLFAIPLFVFAMSDMFGLPLPKIISYSHSPHIHVLVQCLLCLPVLFFARNMFVSGIKGLWNKVPNMDTLIALGTGSAFIYSAWSSIVVWQNHLNGTLSVHGAHADLFFESAGMIIAFIFLGKHLELYAKGKTTSSIKALMDLNPEKAMRVLDGTQEEVLVQQVQVGDILLVRPGTKVPVDGVVIDGASSIDESLLTGESMPVAKEVGSKLVGGSLNGTGVLTMRAEKVGAQTVLAKIIQLVRQAQGSKAPVAHLADTVSLYFVPTVIVISILTFLGWYFLGSLAFADALRRALSVMVIACPCALGLATPTAIMVASGRSAQLGLLFKNGAAIEHLSKVTTIVFDKTGTITEGTPRLQQFIPVDAGTYTSSATPSVTPSVTPSGLLHMAVALEIKSAHPLGQAFKSVVEAENPTLAGIGDIEPQTAPVSFVDIDTTPGKGIEGILEGSTTKVKLGNVAYFQENITSEALRADITVKSASIAQQGQTPIVMGVDSVIVGVFAVADTVRKEAPDVIRHLQDNNIDCVLVSGDVELSVQAVARNVGFAHYVAEALPETKEQFVVARQQEGQIVAMLGDGVNDAPALARAHVGIAIQNGVDVALEAGDVVLLQSNLWALSTAIDLGKATLRIIKQNLFWAFGYNVIGIPLAAGVLTLFGGPALSPMYAGAAMALSSVSVVTNALRLRWFKR